MRGRGPTRIGAIRPALAASMTAWSELSSHGWATAVRVGGNSLQRAIRRSYFSCLRSMASSPRRQAQAGRLSLQHRVNPLEHCTLPGSRLHAEEALVREQALEERQQARAIGRIREQARQRRDRAVELVAHDDVLLAADAPL